MLCSALLVAVSVGAGAPAADDKAPPLPAEWHGVWCGELVITGPGDKPSKVPLVLKVEPLAGGGFAWVATYGEGAKAVVKDYKLLPDAKRPGRFRIDEGNGIVLGARLVDGVLYSQFAVGGAVLAARYELRGEVLRFEVTSARPAAEKTGDGKVQDYPLDVVQAAELRKK